ncbi:UNVERIFIED_CONTAM: Kinesin-like protein KIN-13B [Sesamum angustifolium]|uniref:Kinesin-like protein n=1 Tax=Sesamum angustifolium TaxID=2727405 RepID=A0AAW2LJF7_9LAMI
MREDGKQQVCIVGLQEYRVSDVETIKELIEKGNATRSTGTTGANEESSRSHAILQLTIKRSADGSESKPARVVGKLSFIDLAGSERGADTTDNDKQTSDDIMHFTKLRICEHTLNTLRYADRVKSLSKGNSKKDVLSSISNLKESTAQPLSSAVPPSSVFEDDTGDSWPEQTDREENDEDFYEAEKPSWKKSTKVESYNFSNMDDKMKKGNGQAKWTEPPKAEMKHSNSDDNLSSLLKEEEDLVNAHRKQVEETMDIVREEMNLLVEADQPGNQLDDYISRLNSILSHKAAGILQLQTDWLISKNA